MKIERRDFLKLAGMGSAILVIGPKGIGSLINGNADQNDFYFIQISDTHWGFNDPKINPDFTGTLKKAITAINSMKSQPDFIIFTGDITHTTEDPKERRKRLGEARDIINGLKVKNVKFMPGEHDAGLDNGEAFKEFFGETHYVFKHKNVNFIVLDNVSDPTSSIGDTQLQWLAGELKKLNKNERIIVLTHRPLFDLYPDWDWWTRDGAKALELLKPYKNITVFYGHIHQENHHIADQITHHSCKGMMYPLPAPGSVPKKAPIPWDASQPYKGIGYRSVEAKAAEVDLTLVEYSIQAELTGQTDQVVKITARKFEYSPAEITIKKGVPVILEFTSLDRKHGFLCPSLGIRTDIEPGKVARVPLTPDKTGVFSFHCDIFCGEGHEDMTGKIIVTD
jgi:heme/copper-type cytochrome/quinol oxidase subunit 2